MNPFLGQLDDSLFPSYAENPWYRIIEQGIQTAGDVAGSVWGDGYISPRDPRYQQRQTTVYAQQQPVVGGQVRTASDGAGINLSKDTLMLIAGGILIYLVASRRR